MNYNRDDGEGVIITKLSYVLRRVQLFVKSYYNEFMVPGPIVFVLRGSRIRLKSHHLSNGLHASLCVGMCF